MHPNATTSRGLTLLVTGGSGFLGRAMLACLVPDPAYRRILVLIRAKNGATVDERLRQLATRLFPRNMRAAALAKLEAVAGDLEAEDLGLSPDMRARLTRDLDQILHLGASTDFSQPLADARRINVEGTAAVVALAEAARAGGRHCRLDYVSTAFVAGRTPGVVDERTLERGQEFANAYERSKFEAEIRVRSHAATLPVVIYRPSVVVGDSRTGFTPEFKVLYWPLRVLAQNVMPFIPLNRRARIDVVPVDYVAHAIRVLMTRGDSIGRTFHLTAGVDRAVRAGDILRVAVETGLVTPRPVIPVWMLSALRRWPLRHLFDEAVWRTVDYGSPYLSYLQGSDVRFDSRATERHLAALGVKPPPSWRDYGRRILAYPGATRWGRRLVMNEFEYYALGCEAPI